MHDTLSRLEQIAFPAIQRASLGVLQVNLGYRCNQRCLHCHVNAGPNRREEMSAQTAAEVVDFMRRARPKGLHTLDMTGGAPELNAHFRELVGAAADLGLQVIDRCNLSILLEPGQEDLGLFLAAQRVRVVASLPCYLEENVDAQRGNGVFAQSLEGLRRLNQLGFGVPDSGLELDLVYNPQGTGLPPEQSQLEMDYKRELAARYGIQFNRLLTIANMPIARFGSTLISKGQFDAYLGTLQDAHQPDNLAQVMCRDLISVDYQGYVYDCDFNQMLGLPSKLGNNAAEDGRVHIRSLQAGDLHGADIRVAGHCYGCTAGQGSSCGGSLA